MLMTYYIHAYHPHGIDAIDPGNLKPMDIYCSNSRLDNSDCFTFLYEMEIEIDEAKVVHSLKTIGFPAYVETLQEKIDIEREEYMKRMDQLKSCLDRVLLITHQSENVFEHGGDE